MKLVAVSDLHLDHVTLGVARAPEVYKAVDASVDFAIASRADVWACLGDLMDPDCGAQAFRHTEFLVGRARRLAEAGIHSLWLGGNHDVEEDSAGGTTLSPLKQLWPKYVHVLDAPRVLHLPCHQLGAIVALPFTPASRPYDPAAFLAEALGPTPREGYMDVVLSHLSVEGIIPGEETAEMPRGREVMLPLELLARPDVFVMQGHYHRRQVHRHKGATVHVVGSAARLTFGEQAHEPAFMRVGV